MTNLTDLSPTDRETLRNIYFGVREFRGEIALDFSFSARRVQIGARDRRVGVPTPEAADARLARLADLRLLIRTGAAGDRTFYAFTLDGLLCASAADASREENFAAA